MHRLASPEEIPEKPVSPEEPAQDRQFFCFTKVL
jgi:hypothetical protein